MIQASAPDYRYTCDCCHAVTAIGETADSPPQGFATIKIMPTAAGRRPVGREVHCCIRCLELTAAHLASGRAADGRVWSA